VPRTVWHSRLHASARSEKPTLWAQQNKTSDPMCSCDHRERKIRVGCRGPTKEDHRPPLRTHTGKTEIGRPNRLTGNENARARLSAGADPKRGIAHELDFPGNRGTHIALGIRRSKSGRFLRPAS